MCGIVGYCGARNAGEVVLGGLKKLEYRGYDSWGIATRNSKIDVVKDVGKIGGAVLGQEELGGKVGIGHTRWSTHGKVTRENAHPHLSCDGGVAIVHNGIIENYSSIKERLMDLGHEFSSDTDSEVIAHLIEEKMKGRQFKEGVRLASLELEGSFAFVAMSRSDDELVAARNESPLVVGVGKNEYFLASDVPAFLEYTRDVVFMEDGEMAVLNGGLEIYDIKTGVEREKHVDKIEWSPEQATKGDYSHFMLKEIYEQPYVMRQTLRQDVGKLREVARLMNIAPRVCIIACGTSRHASLVGRYVISKIGGRYCEVYMASEFQYFIDKLGKDTLIIAVSQSGETADVLGPVKQAKKEGCKVVSIVNVVGSSLDRESDVSIYLNAGPEIAVASTKAFTSQVTVFYLLAYTLAYRLEEGVHMLEDMPEMIEYTLKNTEKTCQGIAKMLSKKSDVYYLARGENFAVATEGALKMKEISYLHAEGMPAGEMKHGTLALIEEGTPVVAICPRDYTFAETISNISEAKSRGAHIIGISDQNCKEFDEWLEIPDVDALYYPLLANIPCQLLAYYTAVERGNDVDKPRNLAKSVTVK